MGYNLNAECSTYMQSNIISEVQDKSVSKLIPDSIEKLDETLEEKLEGEEEPSLAYMPTGPAKLVFTKVNIIS